ncbi:hypothetical protein HMPREF1870_02116 [Bacteroidales bacterium KA00344]|nr:hypothetical protein HMPREF1870_02116 [Bacteroidales bacterium KA00344]
MLLLHLLTVLKRFPLSQYDIIFETHIYNAGIRKIKKELEKQQRMFLQFFLLNCHYFDLPLVNFYFE